MTHPDMLILTAPFDPCELFAKADLGGHTVKSLDGTSFDFLYCRGNYTRADIARSLGRIPRFMGQTSRVYTVAEHCLWVATWLERIALAQGSSHAIANALALAGLGHDAHEALVGDMPSPLKSVPVVRGYRELERSVDEATWRMLGLQHVSPGASLGPVPYLTRADWDLVHVADRLAYMVENRDLRGGPNDPRMPQDRIVPCGDAAVASQRWLDEINKRSPL